MNNLSNRMKTFSGSRLQQGIESLTSQVTHSHDTELEDDLFHPNPVIVDEFYDIIDEEDALDSDDTVMNLLSDSTEALRRLEILQMNVNYPVSGYQMSRSTLMVANPGLESLIPNRIFNKSVLNQGIESGKSKMIIAAVTALVAFLASVAAMVMAIFRRRANTTEEESVEDAETTLRKASQSLVMIRPPVSSPDIAYRRSTVATSGIPVKEPKPPKDLGEVRKMELQMYTRDVYLQLVWPSLPINVQHRLLSEVGSDNKIVSKIKEVSEYLGDHIDSLTKLIRDVTDNVKTDGDLVTNKVSMFESDNREATARLDALIEEIPKYDSSTKKPAAPDFDLFLVYCKHTAQAHASVDYSKLARAAKKVENIQTNLKKMVNQLNQARDLPPNTWVVVGKLNTITGKTATAMKLIAEEARVEASTSKIMRDMAKHIRKMSLDSGKD